MPISPRAELTFVRRTIAGSGLRGLGVGGGGRGHVAVER